MQAGCLLRALIHASLLRKRRGRPAKGALAASIRLLPTARPSARSSARRPGGHRASLNGVDRAHLFPKRIIHVGTRQWWTRTPGRGDRANDRAGHRQWSYRAPWYRRSPRAPALRPDLTKDTPRRRSPRDQRRRSALDVTCEWITDGSRAPQPASPMMNHTRPNRSSANWVAGAACRAGEGGWHG